MKQSRNKQQAIGMQTANGRNTTITAKRSSSYKLLRPENFPMFTGFRKFTIEVLFPNGKEGTHFFEGSEPECLNALVSCICEVFGAEQSVSLDFYEVSNEEFGVTVKTDNTAEQRGISFYQAPPAGTSYTTDRPILAGPVLVIGAVPAHSNKSQSRRGFL